MVENYTCLNNIFYCINCYLNTQIEAPTQKYYFDVLCLIDKPFELTDEEAEFFKWEGNRLWPNKLKYYDIYKFLKTKTDDDLIEKQMLMKSKIHEIPLSNKLNEDRFMHDKKMYAHDFRYVLFSYFFGIDGRRDTEFTINRGQ